MYIVAASRTVMLPTSSDTLLAVIGTFQFCEIGMGINGSEKYCFVLGTCSVWRAIGGCRHAPDSCQHWQKEGLDLHTGWWTTKGRMCDRWIESIQKRFDVSALQREDGQKWTWCADIFVPN